MTVVNTIWNEVKKLIGNSDDTVAYQRLTDAVELLACKGDFDAFMGTLDISTNSRCVTLPPDVETVLAVNICGRPALARDELFQFHLNGPGSCGPAIRWEWMDLNQSPVYRQPSAPGQLLGYCVESGDVNAEVWVYGFDQNQNAIRTKLPDGTYRDGWKVPIFLSTGSVGVGAPYFARITSVRKSVTGGPIRLASVTDSTEVLIAVYQAYETIPLFRQIRVSTNAAWVRIFFRKRSVEVRSRYDLIPVEPRQAILMAIRALKKYDEPGGFAEAEAFEATAVRWMTERQHTLAPAVAQPVQVVDDAASLHDKTDHID